MSEFGFDSQPTEDDLLDIEMMLENGQTAVPIGDKKGLAYDIKDKQGHRVSIINVMTEQAIRKNPDLRYLRYVVQTLYRMQRCRIAAGNGQYQLEKALRVYLNPIDDALIPDEWKQPRFKFVDDVDLPDAIHGGKGAVYTHASDSKGVPTSFLIRTGKRAYIVERQDEAVFGVYSIDPKIPDLQEKAELRMLEIENAMELECSRTLKDFEIWTEYLEKIKGVGPRIAGLLIATVATPRRFTTCSALWKYFGMAVIDGEIQKRKSGEMAGYSAAGKQICFKLGESFIKTKGGYRELYDQFKAREVAMNEARPKDEQLSKGHVNRRAIRRTVKIFLSHFLVVWRRQHGLSTRTPYPMEYLGHETVIEPFLDV